MQTKDLTPGLVVGYVGRRDGHPATATRAIVLDDRRWKLNRFSWGLNRFAPGSGKDSGIPVAYEVVDYTYDDEGNRVASPIHGGKHWVARLINPAMILGTWDEVEKAADRQRATEAERREAQAADRASYDVAKAADTAAAAAFGVTIWTNSSGGPAPGTYVISRGDLLKLLAAAGHRVPA
jgi:hypothetical protein